jgi:hypothetical protein
MYEISSDSDGSNEMSDDEFFQTHPCHGMDEDILNPADELPDDELDLKQSTAQSSSSQNSKTPKTKKQLAKQKLAELRMLKPFPRPLAPNQSYYGSDGNILPNVDPQVIFESKLSSRKGKSTKPPPSTKPPMSKTETKEKVEFYERLWSFEEKKQEEVHIYTGPAEGPTVAPLSILDCLQLFITDEYSLCRENEKISRPWPSV